MSEYIARPSLMAKLTSNETQHAMREMDGSQAYNLFLSLLNAETAADVVEVKHGRWINRRFGSADVICSECRTLETNRDSNYKTRFCPNCGAKMDGE